MVTANWEKSGVIYWADVTPPNAIGQGCWYLSVKALINYDTEKIEWMPEISYDVGNNYPYGFGEFYGKNFHTKEEAMTACEIEFKRLEMTNDNVKQLIKTKEDLNQ